MNKFISMIEDKNILKKQIEMFFNIDGKIEKLFKENEIALEIAFIKYVSKNNSS